MASIMLNGTDFGIEKELTVSDLLKVICIKNQGTAVAVNDNIVPLISHDKHLIKDGDRVEVIRAIGGG